METALTVVVATTFVAWFVLSVVNQFRPRWLSVVLAHDGAHLIPCWTFFAPNPGRHDRHLVYRIVSANGPGPWLEITPPDLPRARWIWNPARTERKALGDLINNLHRTARTRRDLPRSVMLTSPYLALLAWVLEQPNVADADACQFALARSQATLDGRDLAVEYASEVHRVDA